MSQYRSLFKTVQVFLFLRVPPGENQEVVTLKQLLETTPADLSIYYRRIIGWREGSNTGKKGEKKGKKGVDPVLRVAPRPQSEMERGGQRSKVRIHPPRRPGLAPPAYGSPAPPAGTTRVCQAAPPTATPPIAPHRRPRSTGGPAGGPCCCRSWRPLGRTDGLAEAKGRNAS